MKDIEKTQEKSDFYYCDKKDIVEDKYSVKGTKLKMKSDNRKLRQEFVNEGGTV